MKRGKGADMRKYRERTVARILSTGATPYSERNTIPKQVEPRGFIEPLPLPPISELDGEGITWTKYAINCLAERNIGFYEALAAVLQPNETRAKSEEPQKDVRIRGDVRVIYNRLERVVIAVASLNSHDTNPRTPLRPPEETEGMPTIGETLNDKQKAALTKAAPKFQQPQEPEPAGMAAGEAFDRYVEEGEPGHWFTRHEVYGRFKRELLAHYADEQTALKNVSNAGYTRLGRGTVKKPLSGAGYMIPTLSKAAKKTASAPPPRQPEPQPEQADRDEELLKTLREDHAPAPLHEEEPPPPPPDAVPPMRELEKPAEPALPEPWDQELTIGQIKERVDAMILPLLRRSDADFTVSETRDGWELRVTKPKEG